MDDFDLDKVDEETNSKSVQYCKLNHYGKNKVLHLMQENGSEKEHCKGLYRKLKCHPSVLENYVNNQALSSQKAVEVECRSQTLERITSWIESFKESGLHMTGCKELSLAMKIIGNLNDHPSPEESGGINFRELYTFIGNVMNGNPTVELDEKTRTYLCDTFGELIDDINSAEGDERSSSLLKEILNVDDKDVKGMTLEEQMLQVSLNPLILKFPCDERVDKLEDLNIRNKN